MTGFTIPIDWGQIRLIVLILFAIIGAMRGWLREIISTGFLVLLLVVRVMPGVVTPIVGYVARLLRLVIAFLQAPGNLEPAALTARFRDVSLPFSAENPNLFFVIVLVAFAIFSYGTRDLDRGLTALSRILGGLLGLFNGYLIMALLRDFLASYFRLAAPDVVAAAGGSPPGINLQLQNMPRAGLLQEGGQFVLLFLLLVVGAVIAANVFNPKLLGKK